MMILSISSMSRLAQSGGLVNIAHVCIPSTIGSDHISLDGTNDSYKLRFCN